MEGTIQTIIIASTFVVALLVFLFITIRAKILTKRFNTEKDLWVFWEKATQSTSKKELRDISFELYDYYNKTGNTREQFYITLQINAYIRGRLEGCPNE